MDRGDAHAVISFATRNLGVAATSLASVLDDTARVVRPPLGWHLGWDIVNRRRLWLTSVGWDERPVRLYFQVWHLPVGSKRPGGRTALRGQPTVTWDAAQVASAPSATSPPVSWVGFPLMFPDNTSVVDDRRVLALHRQIVVATEWFEQRRAGVERGAAHDDAAREAANTDAAAELDRELVLVRIAGVVPPAT